MNDALSGPVEALLDGANNETWSSIRKLLRCETESGFSGLSTALSGFDMDQETILLRPFLLRNYYRCTSTGCPIRKHIETAVDNTSAVIITYKGVHDHDMLVPKKRHGPLSTPLVAATTLASMANLQLKKDIVQSQLTPTQWSVRKEGELISETLDRGGEKEK